jgi:hypothetical protein
MQIAVCVRFRSLGGKLENNMTEIYERKFRTGPHSF